MTQKQIFNPNQPKANSKSIRNFYPNESSQFRIHSDPFGLKVWTDSDLFGLRFRIDFKWASDWYGLKLVSDFFGIIRIGSETDFWMGRIGLE